MTVSTSCFPLMFSGGKQIQFYVFLAYYCSLICGLQIHTLVWFMKLWNKYIHACLYAKKLRQTFSLFKNQRNSDDAIFVSCFHGLAQLQFSILWLFLKLGMTLSNVHFESSKMELIWPFIHAWTFSTFCLKSSP